MREEVLFPEQPYKYCYDESLDHRLVSQAITVWRDTWESLPLPVRETCTTHLHTLGYHTRHIVAFRKRADFALKTFAFSLRYEYMFEFKPEVLRLFEDAELIKAIYAHEFAHVYLASIGDPLHRVGIGDLPGIEEAVRAARHEARELKADECAATWGFAVANARAKERQLRLDYPEYFHYE